MSKMTLEVWGETVNLNVVLDKYNTYGNLHIGLWSDGEPFADLTTNIYPLGSDNLAAIDTNNCPWATVLIKKYELGERTGNSVRSGFCDYPIYRFNMDKLKEYM